MARSTSFPDFNSPIELPGYSSCSPGLNSYQQHFFDCAQSLSERTLADMEIDERRLLVTHCLTEAEQKKILKKSGISIKHLAADHLIERLTRGLSEPGLFLNRVERFLKKKFRAEVEELLSLSKKSFMNCWKERLDAGGIEGIFYIAFCRIDLSPENRFAIISEFKNALQKENEQVRQMEKKLDMTKDCVLDLSNRLKKKSKLCREQTAEIHQLRETVEKLSLKLRICENLETETVKNEAEELKKQNIQLQSQLEKSQQTGAQLESKLNKLSARFEKNKNQLTRVDELNHELLRKLEFLSHQHKPKHPCVEDHTKECDPSTCNKRVLVVGGMTKIKHLYRDLIETGGGAFEYHDGHIKGGWISLENKVCKSDIVLCPVNCNSHGACLKVKQLCKKYNKPIHMLHTSSISGISDALTYN
jgi:hypothetical protein